MAALLFTLEDLKRSNAKQIPQETATSCTSVVQQWHVPPKYDVMPRPVNDIAFLKPEFGKITFIKASLSTEAIVSVSANKDAVEELLATVSQRCANSGLLHFWVKPITQSEIAVDTTAIERQVQELIV